MAKKGSGGARPGAGRKPVEYELRVKEHIKEALAKDPNALPAIWAKVISEAKKGSEKHTQIFFNYFYGKPKENLEQPNELTIRVVRE